MDRTVTTRRKIRAPSRRMDPDIPARAAGIGLNGVAGNCLESNVRVGARDVVYALVIKRWLWTLMTLVSIGCLSGDSARYSPERDDEAFAAIASTWTFSGGDLTVSLCEDTSAVEDTNTCQVEHTVRGGGRGKEHDEEHGGAGCGGCPFANVAYVTGRISGGGFAVGTIVKGEIQLGGGVSDEPYEYPYSVRLDCVAPAQSCYLTGTLEADGTLNLDLDPFSATPMPSQMLARSGDASCP